MNRAHWPLRLLLTSLVLALFAVSPQARATCQEGCLTNQSTALGDDALLNNASYSNTALGFNALYFNTFGHSNTASGFQALFNNTTGSNNIALGNGAGEHLTTGSWNIHIGNAGIAGESKTIRIGSSGAVAVFRELLACRDKIGHFRRR